MTAHQINLSIFPMAEALPDSRLNASRIEFAVRTAVLHRGCWEKEGNCNHATICSDLLQTASQRRPSFRKRQG